MTLVAVLQTARPF